MTDCVERIDRIYLPSTINNMINLSQVKRNEQKIFRILAGASKDELNFILNNIRLALLFYKVKDHSKLRSDQSRTLILDLLCTTRLADLTVTSRAIVLDALMVMKLSAHPLSEKWVRNIILKTSGDDLSNLKSYTDAKGDFHSMHKLIYNDIRDPVVRADILNHIAREARVQTAHMRLGTKRASKRRLQAWRKVLSDVDDTLSSSGGRYPAGIDTRYPRHVLYPGVLPFYRELDMGTAGPDEWTPDRVGNLVFLSARPHVYKDMSEKKSYAKFSALYEKKGMHTVPTMLAGNLRSGRAFMVQGDLEPMAQKKFENFGEYYQLYPEFTHVFVGDNGQGDVRAAELIVEKFGPDALEAGFFHLVQPIEKTYGYKSKETLEKWRKMKIVFFNTYVGAAVEAFKMKKVRLTGLYKICSEAVTHFDGIERWPSLAERERARVMLNEDLQRANEVLRKNAIAEVPYAMKPQVFALNSLVRTPFGRAIIRKFRGFDGIYCVDLVDWHSMVRKKRVQAFIPDESIVALVVGETTQIAKSSVKYVKFRKAQLLNVFPAQTVVNTPFGTGRVTRFRPEDETYVVSIEGRDAKMNVTGFFTASAITAVVRDMHPSASSPRMFAGVRSGLGYITKKLSNFVPGTSGGKPYFAIGSSVDSPFGRGVVVQFRPADRVYELELMRFNGHPPHSNMGIFVQEKCLTESSISPPRSFFSMWGLGSASSKSADIRSLMAQGVSVSTPYGRGTIRSYRDNDGIYEIVLTDWTLARGQEVVAFLNKSMVREVAQSINDVPILSLTTKGVAGSVSEGSPPTSGGIFQLFRYGFQSSGSSEIVCVPYADEGSNRRFNTVFGVGKTAMARPYNGCLKMRLEQPDLENVIAYVQSSDATEMPPARVRKNTLELFGNPFSYLGWASSAEMEAGGGISTTEPLFPKGVLVVTSFGEGQVAHYRHEDNVYVVHLPGSVVGYFRPKSLSRPVRGVLGMPVNTTFGSGLLVDVRERDGVHVVSLRQALMSDLNIQGFLQPSAVIGILKAARGDLVMTPFGTGVVIHYRPKDGFYCVALEWDPNGRSHVSAYIREADIVRAGPVEKNSSGCLVM